MTDASTVSGNALPPVGPFAPYTFTELQSARVVRKRTKRPEPSSSTKGATQDSPQKRAKTGPQRAMSSTISSKPPSALSDLKSAGRFDQWIKWARGVWDDLRVQRQKRLGNRENKYARQPPQMTAKAKAVRAALDNAKNAAAGAAKKRAPPTLKIIAPVRRPDEELPSISQRNLIQCPPLRSVNDLFHPKTPPTMSAAHLRTLLNLFDLIGAMAEALTFDCAPQTLQLSTFMRAFTAPPSDAAADSHLVNSIMSAIVNAILKPDDIKKGPMRIEDKVKRRMGESSGHVVNRLTWCHRLCEWLSTHESTPHGRNGKSLLTKQVKLLSAHLTLDDFTFLSIEDRMTLITYCIDTLYSSSWFRSYQTKAIEHQTTARKTHTTNAVAIGIDSKTYAKSLSDVATVLAKLVDDVVVRDEDDRYAVAVAVAANNRLRTQMKKPKHVTAKPSDASSYPSLVTRGNQWIAQERLERMTNNDNALRDTLLAWPLRTAPLGHDRFFNQYWILANSTQQIVIEADSSNVRQDVLSNNEWFVIQRKSRLNQFTAQLVPHGIREFALLEAIRTVSPPLSLFEDTIAPYTDSLSAEDFDRLTVDSSMIDQSFFKCFDVNKSLFRCTAVLVADGHGDSYDRCLLCQEATDRREEWHCVDCHLTIKFNDEMAEAIAERHKASCPGDSALVSVKSDDDFSAATATAPFPADEIEVILPSTSRQSDDLNSDDDGDDDGDGDGDDVDMEDNDDGDVDNNRMADDADGETNTTTADGSDAHVKPEGETTTTSTSTTTSTQRTENEANKKRSIIIRRVSVRPKSLHEVSVVCRVLKAIIFDIEAAIPVEAVRRSAANARLAWIEAVKFACTVEQLGRCLSDLLATVKLPWLRPFIKASPFVEQCAVVRTESHLADLIVQFDRGLIYSENEKIEVDEEIERKSALKESGQGSDTDMPAADDGCVVCHGIDQPDRILICDDCEAQYHTFCLNPPLKRVPRGSWYCPKCTVVEEEEAPMEELQQPKSRGRPSKSALNVSPSPSPSPSTSPAPDGASLAKRGRGRPKKSQNVDDDEDEDGEEEEEQAADEDDEDEAYVQENGDDDADDEPEVEDDVGADGDYDDEEANGGEAADEEEGEQVACRICGQEWGSPIQCDHCLKAYHLSCLQPPLTAVPDGEWKCPQCQADDLMDDGDGANESGPDANGNDESDDGEAEYV